MYGPNFVCIVVHGKYITITCPFLAHNIISTVVFDRIDWKIKRTLTDFQNCIYYVLVMIISYKLEVTSYKVTNTLCMGRKNAPIPHNRQPPPLSESLLNNVRFEASGGSIMYKAEHLAHT